MNGTPMVDDPKAADPPPAGGTLRQRTMKSLFWQLLGVGGQRAVVLVQPIVLAQSGWISPTDVAAFVAVTVHRSVLGFCVFLVVQVRQPLSHFVKC